MRRFIWEASFSLLVPFVVGFQLQLGGVLRLRMSTLDVL
jgi:hypothetical protein